MIKKLDSPPYTIDKTVHGRFDQRQTVFGRLLFDTKADFYARGIYDEIEGIFSHDKPGYSRIDFAQVMGGWTVYDYFHSAFSWDKLGEANNVMDKPELPQYPVDDASGMSAIIKKTAHRYGAVTAGIARFDERWVYSHDRKGKPIDIPDECRYAIVMLIRMDPVAISASPTFTACVETALGYSRMAFCMSCLAEFIRSLGYRAVPMGNDTSLSIPLAVDAGLGEMGRNGLLITPENGSCVRICKVFTDLPLEIDSPIEFGVRRFCRSCSRCVEACEVEAIDDSKEPSFEVACQSNNEGILRWAVDHEKCYKFWLKNGGECSSCIAACPFFPGNSSKGHEKIETSP